MGRRRKAQKKSSRPAKRCPQPKASRESEASALPDARSEPCEPKAAEQAAKAIPPNASPAEPAQPSSPAPAADRKLATRPVLVGVVCVAVLLVVGVAVLIGRNRDDGGRGALAPTARTSRLEAVPDTTSTPGVAAENPRSPKEYEPVVAKPQRAPATPPVMWSLRPRDAGADWTPRAKFWWTSPPDEIREASVAPGVVSNVRLEDYAGAESCKDCHAENYQTWSEHPHRWMNAMATEQTVKGDFSGGEQAKIDFRGGRGTFYRENGQYRMRLERDGLRRVFDVRRTIGSRFQQYYVGKMIEGPEPSNHRVRHIDHVLPFGYWLDRKEWVPVVHVEGEVEDEKRFDPFKHPPPNAYERTCSACHTTQPAGDRLVRGVGRERVSTYAPHNLSFSVQEYLKETHPDLVESFAHRRGGLGERIQGLMAAMDELPAEHYAATLGIACEACHNGSRDHVENEMLRPRFFPSSQHVLVEGESDQSVWGRTSKNLNWTCAQCHSGKRTMFAAEVSTWNSTELTDAMRGHCYDPEKTGLRSSKHLTCVHCHDPHVATGKRWSHTPAQDDQKCIACHQEYDSPDARVAHTHHEEGTEGGRCMNCHMPRLNEGMQDVVRTHKIFSPTNVAMIEANQPNACNLCHLKQPIDWTLKYLSKWYGLKERGEVGTSAAVDDAKVYSAEKLAANYPAREGPTGIGWLKSPHEATRLVTSEAMTKADAKWALPELIEMLDDPFLLNRQFTMQGLERMLGIRLEDYGYRFYMYADERREPLAKIRQALLGTEPAPQAAKQDRAAPLDTAGAISIAPSTSERN